MQADKRKLVFENARDREVGVIKKVLSEMFGTECVEDFLKNNIIVVARNKRYEVFLVSTQLYEMFMEIKNVGLEPYSIGLFLGRMYVKKNRIRYIPSLESSEVLYNISRRNAIMVNEKATQLALYGRNIFWENVIRIFPPIHKKYVVVITSAHEPIALGRIRELNHGKKIIEVLIDKGWYLRKGG